MYYLLLQDTRQWALGSGHWAGTGHSAQDTRQWALGTRDWPLATLHWAVGTGH